MKHAFKEKLLFLYDYVMIRIVYPCIYRYHARKPVQKNKVILLEPRFPETTDSLLEIRRELTERGGYEILEMSLGLGLLRLPEQRKRIIRFLREMATAGTVFTTDSNKAVGGFEKRPETCMIQVWHACGAFKKFGFSTAEKSFGVDRRNQELIRHHHNYDIVTVSSPEVVWAYEEAMGLSGTGIVQPLGISRTDVFYDRAFVESASRRVLELIPESAHRKILLYAPTFRGRVNQASAPDALDMIAMKRALGDRYVLLLKHHPFVKVRPAIPEECRGFAFDVTELLEIDTLLCAADLCISDYSSLIFEYSLFERPMIFLAYDLEDYYDWRGFYYDYDTMTPGPVVRTTEEVIEEINAARKSFDPSEVRRFRERFMGSCDGRATGRILEAAGLGLEV